MSDFADANQFPFTALDLTAAVNILPPQWGRITEMGIFDPVPISTTNVEIVRNKGKLAILSDEMRGTMPNVAEGERPRQVIVPVMHLPWLDTITPDDIQNLVSFVGNTRTPRTMESEMNKRLMNVRRRGDITNEFLKMGALKGKIVDGKGAELYDWFQIFNITQLEVDFKLGTATTDIREKCEEVVAHIEDNLLDDVMTDVRVLVDPKFFGGLVEHPKVEKFFQNHSEHMRMAGRDIRRNFPLHGLNFEEYRATAAGIDGQTHRFIAEKNGHAFPEGTGNTFGAVNAPPHDVRFANQLVGEEMYISPKVLDHGQGIELACQMNPLQYCTRPEVLVRVYSSD